MKIRALIFDVGGVLLHFPKGGQQLGLERQYGLADGAIARALWGSDVSTQAALGRATPDEVWVTLGQSLALTTDQLARVRETFFGDEYMDPVMENLLRRLHPTYRLAILTNAWSDVRPVLTHKFPLSQMVDEIIISAEEGVGKPDPAIFQLTLARLGVSAQEALFIDDKQVNITAAEALGIRSVLFRDALQATADIQRRLEEL